MSKTTIVILGAGFGGLRAAINLSRLLKNIPEAEIILVDREPYHVQYPLLYEVATGYFNKEETSEEETRCENALKEGACINIKKFAAIAANKQIRFMEGEAERIDKVNRAVIFSDKDPLHYDILLVALGAETDYFGVPGLEAHAIPFKTLNDAFAMRRQVRDFVDAKRRGVEKKVTLVIGGAGATGVEVAGEFIGFLNHYKEDGILKPKDYSVTLVEAASRVLPMFDEVISRWAHERLKKLGVKIMLSTLIRRADAGKVVVAPRLPAAPDSKAEAMGPEEIIEADVLVWTGGVRANSVLAVSGFVVDKKGRADVAPTLLLKGEDRIFAIGDNALLANPKLGFPEPMLAFSAIEEGKVAAKNILHILQNEPLEEYNPVSRVNAVIPLGGKYALAQVFGFRLRGFLAWILRQVIDLRYFLTILPIRKAILFWARGERVYTRND